MYLTWVGEIFREFWFLIGVGELKGVPADFKGAKNKKNILLFFQIDVLYRPLVNSKSANQNWETSRPIRIEKNLQLKKTEQSNNFSKMVPNPNHQIQGGRPYRDTLQRYSNKEWYQIYLDHFSGAKNSLET